MATDFVLDALEQALYARQPDAEPQPTLHGRMATPKEGLNLNEMASTKAGAVQFTLEFRVG